MPFIFTSEPADPGAPPPLFIQNKEGSEVTQPMVSGEQGAQPGTSAPGAPQNAQQAEPPGLLSFFWPILLMIALMYFLVLRPQRKRDKEASKLRSSLSKGDEVLMSGGMRGTITGIEDDWVTVEVADKVRIKFQKASVVTVLSGDRQTAAAKSS